MGCMDSAAVSLGRLGPAWHQDSSFRAQVTARSTQVGTHVCVCVYIYISLSLYPSTQLTNYLSVALCIYMYIYIIYMYICI